jgi:hypothetical protein
VGPVRGYATIYKNGKFESTRVNYDKVNPLGSNYNSNTIEGAAERKKHRDITSFDTNRRGREIREGISGKVFNAISDAFSNFK